MLCARRDGTYYRYTVHFEVKKLCYETTKLIDSNSADQRLTLLLHTAAAQ